MGLVLKTLAQPAPVRSLGVEAGSLVFRDEFLSPLRYAALPVGLTFQGFESKKQGAANTECSVLYGVTSPRRTLRYDVVGALNRYERLFRLHHSQRATTWWGPALSVGGLVRLRRPYPVGDGVGNNFAGGDVSLGLGLALRGERRLGDRALLRGQAHLPLVEGLLSAGPVHPPQVFRPRVGEVFRTYASVQPVWNRLQVQSRLSLDFGLREAAGRRGPRTRGWRASYAFAFQRFEKPVAVRLGYSLLGLARVF